MANLANSLMFDDAFQPIPPLSLTAKRFLDWLAPLTDASTYQDSESALDAFLTKDGERLQMPLEAFARTQKGSWASQLKTLHQLSNHDSLPLSGNIAMQIHFHASQTGLKRVAHFAHALLRVHQRYQAQSDKLPAALLAWPTLAGSARRVDIPIDYQQVAQPASHHIVISYRGYAWKVAVIDTKGQLATVAQIEQLFYELTEQTESKAKTPFAIPAFLTGKEALEIRAQLISRSENSEIWQQIDTALFVLSLDNDHHNDLSDALSNVLFMPEESAIWPYKTLNFRCNWRNNQYYLHSEMTHTELSQLQLLIKSAQAIYDDALLIRRNGLGEALEAVPLLWTIDEKTAHLLTSAHHQYKRRAANLTLSAVEIFLTHEQRQILKNYSDNSIVQLMLQYAQLQAYGKVRATLEAIPAYGNEQDYHSPVSYASLQAIEAMQNNALDRKLFEQYQQEYAQALRVSQKMGSLYRHLLGLQTMDHKLHHNSDFFRHISVKQLMNPFIYSINTGKSSNIGAIALAPPHAEGLTVHHHTDNNHYSILITHRRAQTAAIARFKTALESGLRKILRALND